MQRIARLLIGMGGIILLAGTAGCGMPALHRAALENDPDTVTRIVRDAPEEVDAQWGRRFQTPLHHAAKGDAVEAASALLKAGADINARSDMGDTPIYLAAEADATATATFLLDQGADPNLRPYAGAPPLHRAAANGNTELVIRLLGAGAKARAIDFEGTNALTLAVENNHLDTAAELFSRAVPGTPGELGKLVLMAVRGAAFRTIEEGTSKNSGTQTYRLIQADGKRKKELLDLTRRLLKAGANPDLWVLSGFINGELRNDLEAEYKDKGELPKGTIAQHTKTRRDKHGVLLEYYSLQHIPGYGAAIISIRRGFPGKIYLSGDKPGIPALTLAREQDLDDFVKLLK